MPQGLWRVLSAEEMQDQVFEGFAHLGCSGARCKGQALL